MAQQPVKLPPNHLLIAGQGLPPLHSPSLPSWVSLGKGCSIATAPAESPRVNAKKQEKQEAYLMVDMTSPLMRQMIHPWKKFTSK